MKIFSTFRAYLTILHLILQFRKVCLPVISSSYLLIINYCFNSQKASHSNNNGNFSYQQQTFLIEDQLFVFFVVRFAQIIHFGQKCEGVIAG